MGPESSEMQIHPLGDSLAGSSQAIAGVSASASGTVPVAPWNRLAADLLLAYLVVHAIGLALIAFAPHLWVLREEEPLGRAFLDLIGLNLLPAIAWVVSPLLGAVTFGALWQADMDRRRRRLLGVALAGITLTVVMYVSLIWLGLGDDLWQGEGPPDGDTFREQVRRFTFGNLTVFAAVILGMLGASVADLVKQKGP